MRCDLHLGGLRWVAFTVYTLMVDERVAKWHGFPAPLLSSQARASSDCLALHSGFH